MTRSFKNHTFLFDVINRYGEPSKKVIEAPTLIEAKIKIRQLEFINKGVIKKRTSLFFNLKSPIKSKDITFFTHQLCFLCDAQIPLIQALLLIEKNQCKRPIQQLIASLRHQLEAGLPLAESLRLYPALFNSLFCNLIALGEASGTLNKMLYHLACHYEKMDHFKQQIKKALTYPIAVTLIAMLVTSGLLLFIIPQFQSLFNNFGVALPASTRCIITLSQWILTYWPVLIGLLFSIIFSTQYAAAHSFQFIRMRDRFVLKMPLFGEIILKIIIARFASALAISFSAGFPLVEALIATAPITGNAVFSEGIIQISSEIAAGHQFQLAIARTQLFPDFVIQMISIGEESGTFDEILKKIADYYEKSVDSHLHALNNLLEPAIMTLLGLLIGGLIIALYLPILKLGSLL